MIKNAPLHVIVLAAGEGKRMKSKRAKVLMPLAGRPLLAHVLEAARALQPQVIHLVYGHAVTRCGRRSRARPMCTGCCSRNGWVPGTPCVKRYSMFPTMPRCWCFMAMCR